MPNPFQLEFPYPSLDFPHRATLTPQEIAVRLGCTAKHIREQIESGEMGCINIASKGTFKTCPKIPIEEYRNFIIRRMGGESRKEFMKGLPDSTLQELLNEIHAEQKRRKFR